jgi:hypothetical protein
MFKRSISKEEEQQIYTNIISFREALFAYAKKTYNTENIFTNPAAASFITNYSLSLLRDLCTKNLDNAVYVNTKTLHIRMNTLQKQNKDNTPKID